MGAQGLPARDKWAWLGCDAAVWAKSTGPPGISGGPPGGAGGAGPPHPCQSGPVAEKRGRGMTYSLGHVLLAPCQRGHGQMAGHLVWAPHGWAPGEPLPAARHSWGRGHLGSLQIAIYFLLSLDLQPEMWIQGAQECVSLSLCLQASDGPAPPEGDSFTSSPPALYAGVPSLTAHGP